MDWQPPRLGSAFQRCAMPSSPKARQPPKSSWASLFRVAGVKGGDKDDEGKSRVANQRLVRSTVGAVVAVVLGVAGLHAAFSLSSGQGWHADMHMAGSAALLPQRIHVTVPDSKNVPSELQKNIDSWKTQNAGWQVKVWDDASMDKYMNKYHPDYMHVYTGLINAVEQTDLFRYLILFREGGVYVDADVECLRPLESYLNVHSGSLVLGWDNDWVDPLECMLAQSARKRLLLQWVLSSPPGHPVLEAVAKHVESMYNTTFSKNALRDTGERTGAFALTDVVLKWAIRREPGSSITFLPRAVWGNPGGAWDSSAVKAVRHHSSGSWRDSVPVDDFGSCFVSEYPLAPVTVDWLPKFSIMTHLSGGAGDPDCGEDVCLALNNYGMWQAGLEPAARPNVAQVLGALMSDVGAVHGPGMFVDVGAGYGVYSLAMASLGHDVVAFEMANKSVQSLNATLEYQPWLQERLTLVTAALGNDTQDVCVSRKWPGAVVDEQRGYLRASQKRSSEPQCLAYGHRIQASKLLRGTPHTHVLRVNANGHEPAVIAGLHDLMHEGTVKPYAVLLTWQPAWMDDVTPGSAATMLSMLRGLGYTTVVQAAPGTRCEGEDDFGAELFGLEPAANSSVQWCKVKDDAQLSGVPKAGLTASPTHVLLLRPELRLRWGHHQLHNGALM